MSMRCGAILILLLLNSVYTFAQFYPPSDAPFAGKVQNYPRAVSSSLGFAALGLSQVGRCSGTIISPDGYIISARHCFDRCFDEQYALSESTSQPEGNQIQRVNRSKLPLTCQIGFNGAIQDVTVVATGDCKLGEPQQVGSKTSNENLELRRGGCGSNGDFTIFKVDGQPPLKCSPACARSLGPGEDVWGVGFPSETHRGDGHDSNGKSKYVSAGQVNCGLRDNEDFKSLLAGQPISALISQFRDIAEKIKLNRPQAGADEIYLSLLKFIARTDGEKTGIIPSSTDFAPGSSGGGLFDDQGCLIGVNVSVDDYLQNSEHSKARKVQGGANSISIARVQEILRSQTASESFRTYFNCP
jgi:hypothetical protein